MGPIDKIGRQIRQGAASLRGILLPRGFPGAGNRAVAGMPWEWHQVPYYGQDKRLMLFNSSSNDGEIQQSFYNPQAKTYSLQFGREYVEDIIRPYAVLDDQTSKRAVCELTDLIVNNIYAPESLFTGEDLEAKRALLRNTLFTQDIMYDHVINVFNLMVVRSGLSVLGFTSSELLPLGDSGEEILHLSGTMLSKQVNSNAYMFGLNFRMVYNALEDYWRRFDGCPLLKVAVRTRNPIVLDACMFYFSQIDLGREKNLRGQASEIFKCPVNEKSVSENYYPEGMWDPYTEEFMREKGFSVKRRGFQTVRSMGLRDAYIFLGDIAPNNFLKACDRFGLLGTEVAAKMRTIS